MLIRRIHIENLRGFRDGDLAVDLDLKRPDGSLAGWTVIAGRNGAGKTTLLQAIALALLGSPVRFPGIRLMEWVNESKDRAQVRLFLQPNAETEDGVEIQVRLERSSDKHVSGETTGRGRAELFVVGYGSFRRLSGHASDAQELMSDSGEISRFVTLFRDDASLAETVQWLREVYLRRLEGKRGAEELEQSALHLLQDGLLPENIRIERVDSEGLWITRNGLSLPLTRFSEGYRTVTALVLDIIRHLSTYFGEFKLDKSDGRWVVPYQGVVLIDEIDAHVHVSWQQRIGFWFKEHFPKVQFLVTTHSPFICQAADPKGLIRLPALGEDRAAEHVSEDLFHTIVNGTPDEAAMTELFGLEHPYSDRSERLRQRLAELEFKLLRDQLNPGETKELQELSDQLPRTGTAAVERALRKLQVEL